MINLFNFGKVLFSFSIWESLYIKSIVADDFCSSLFLILLFFGLFDLYLIIKAGIIAKKSERVEI